MRWMMYRWGRVGGVIGHVYAYAHIKEVCRVPMFHLSNIAKIRKCHHISESGREAHPYFCNSLLCGIFSFTTSLSRLQRMRNIAAVILTRTKKHDDISPVLRRLHWLPVARRIIFLLSMLWTSTPQNLASPSAKCVCNMKKIPHGFPKNSPETRLSVSKLVANLFLLRDVGRKVDRRS